MEKQLGGMEPSINKGWCDGHPSQCKDSYHPSQEGGENYYYMKYLKYKNKYNKKKLEKYI